MTKSEAAEKLAKAQERADAAFRRFMENPSSGRMAYATRTARELEEAQADFDLASDD